MRKAAAVFLLATFFSFLFVFPVYGICTTKDDISCLDCPEPGGLVPCGRNCDDAETLGCECEPCTLCHFFVMVDNIIDFLLFRIVPVLAALMIAVGGVMYIVAFGKPEMISRAKSLFTAVVIGLLIIYGAWVFINTFLMFIGINEVNEFRTLPQDWWKIPCP